MRQYWPTDKIQWRLIKNLVPYAHNARTHSPEQIDQIARSIEEFGFTNPILLDERDMIIAGHGRVLAARQLGLDELPCLIAKGWSEAQKRAYIIADNKLALNAGWDEGLLKAELEGLKTLGFDIELTGFSVDDIASLDSVDIESKAGNLAAKFMVPPFSVLNAREGWWQERKRAWLALGIQSELGRGDGAKLAPGNSLLPAADYSKKQRGDGRGRPI